MKDSSVYRDIAARTNGDIYIGVVGPVRTGKSTFIKKFMENLVIPNIENDYKRERATDELPQSAAGKTIMTTEPKFVPEEAVEISPDGKTKLRVRMIDSVGYMVNEVMMVLPLPLWGSSSLARSFLYTFSIWGITCVSINRLIKVDFPVRTGPTTPM